MFFRIFWFKRKQRPAPSSTPRSAKASTRPKPLSLPEYPASTLAQDSAPGSLSPIIFVNRDPKPVSSYAGHVHISANSGSGIFSLRPGMPRKKRHVSFVVIESGAEAGLASSPPTPYPFPSSISPSSSPLNRESVSSVSTLVDADQLPPKPSAVDALAWEDILNESVSSAAGVCTDTGAQTQLPFPTGRDKARVKSRHISMLPSSSKRPKASRFSVPVPTRGGLMPQTPYIPSGSSINTPPLSHRTSRTISVMSTASRSGSVRVNKSKRASRWSQHVNSPETQEVLKALRDMS